MVNTDLRAENEILHTQINMYIAQVLVVSLDFQDPRGLQHDCFQCPT